MPSGVGRLFGRYISVGNEIHQVPIKIYHWRLLSCKVLVIFGAKLGWVLISNMQLQAEMVEVFSWMQKDTESTVITKRLICRAVFYEAIEAGIREHRYLLHYTIGWKNSRSYLRNVGKHGLFVCGGNFSLSSYSLPHKFISSPAFDRTVLQQGTREFIESICLSQPMPVRPYLHLCGYNGIHFL